MDEYVIGSVADIISNKGKKIKSKKVKTVLNENVSDTRTNEKFKNEEPVRDVPKIKKKKKRQQLKEDFNEKFPTEEKNNRISPKKAQEPTTLFNPTSKPKKRKKLKAAETKLIPTKKQKTDILEEDHVPSDSENEEDEHKVHKNPQKNKKIKKTPKSEILNENTVFVGNLPIKYDKLKICKEFSKFGEIINARIRCVPIADINMSKKVAAIKKSFNPKRNSLVAYVNFKSLESAQAAVRANGMVIDGHHLRIDFAEGNKERDNNKAVFVGGLPFDIEDDQLWEFFEKCGKINSVRIVRDSQTSMGKGFGYVNFDSTTSVELALQLDGQELKKRAINVKRCVNSRNKNKLNSFGKKKSKEVANELLCKRGKKFKEERKKLKKEKKTSIDFQGKTANMKQKKKKKLSKSALRQRKLVKILGVS